MLRSQNFSITAAANAEEQQDIFTTPTGFTRKVVGIWGETSDDYILRGYLGTDMILEVHAKLPQFDLKTIPQSVMVPVGEKYTIGVLDVSGSGLTVDVTVWYEEEVA